MTKQPTDATLLNGWKAPKRIWLMDLGCGDVTWCEDKDPDGEQVETVEYVRADLAMQAAAPTPNGEGVDAVTRALHAEMLAIEHDEGGEGGPFDEMSPAQLKMLQRLAVAALEAVRAGDGR